MTKSSRTVSVTITVYCLFLNFFKLFAIAIRLYDHVMINESSDEAIGVDLKRVGFGVAIGLFVFTTTQKNNKSFISKEL